jgi:hypothetical protein
MSKRSYVFVVLVLVTACDHLTSVRSLEVAPSPAAQAHAAAVMIGAPPAEVERASAALAATIAGWDQPQRQGKRRTAPQTDVAALAAASNPAGFAAAMATLDSVVRVSNGRPQP